MSKVNKSNIPYAGADTLSSLSSLEVTAATYTARVEADGGRVVDSTHLSDTFTFIAAQGISPRNLIFGASFGVREVNGKIEKLYAFNGNDLVFQPGLNGSEQLSAWELDETGSFPVLKMDTATGFQTDMRTQSLQYLMKPGDTSYTVGAAGVNMVASDSIYLMPLSAFIPGSTSARAFAIEGFNSDDALNKYRIATPDGTYLTAGTVRVWNAGSPYADYAGVAAWIDTVNRKVTTWNNGVVDVNNSNTDSSGFAWGAGTYSPSADLVRFVMGGAVNNGSSARYNKQKIAEVWHVSGGSSAFGLALSQRLGTL